MYKRQILPYAEEKKIAIPAFNIDTMEITQAILETVEEENCPAIIAVGQAAIKDGKLESLAATVRTLAKDMKTPVVLHLDHGQSVEQVVKALCAGFTSVMIDGSKLSFEDNIAVTQEVVRLCGTPSSFRFCYELTGSVEERIETIVRRVYHGAGVRFTPAARKQIAQLSENGFGALPVCMAKTQYLSLIHI